MDNVYVASGDNNDGTRSMYVVEDMGHEWQWDLSMYVVEDMGHEWAMGSEHV